MSKKNTPSQTHEAPTAEIIPGTSTPQADTTFEIRFSSPMAEKTALGFTSPKPIQIHPNHPGNWTWLSTRSGVFTPTEPWKQNTTYKISLIPNLQTLEKKPIAKLNYTFATPAFSITSIQPQIAPQAPIDSPRTITIHFNNIVNADQLTPHIEFRSKEGHTLRAKIQHVTTWNLVDYYKWYSNLMPWNFSLRPKMIESFKTENEYQYTQYTVPNAVEITPETQITTGTQWHLHIKKQLPDATNLHLLNEEHTIPYGTLYPLIIQDAQAENSPTRGRHILVTLNKSSQIELPKSEIDPKQALNQYLSQWIQIQPTPKNLRYHLERNQIFAFGDYSLDTTYTLNIQTGLPADNNLFTLQKPFKRNFTFLPIPPRIYFQTHSTQQHFKPESTFTIATRNTGPIKLTAHILTPSNLIQVLERHRKQHQKQWTLRGEKGTDNWEPFQAVDFSDLVASPNFETQLTPTAPTDETQVHSIPFKTLIGTATPAPILIQAAMLDPQSGRKTGAQSIIQLTDLGLLWKTSNQKNNTATHWIAVYSLTTGKPISKATVYLYDYEGTSIAMTTANHQGIAYFEDISTSRPLYTIIRHENDLLAQSHSEYSTQLSTYPFNLESDDKEELTDEDDYSDQNNIILFTDRRVYKPGDTLYLKAILREFKDDQITIPKDETLTITLTDPLERLVHTDSLAISDQGSIDHSISLPTHTLGRYSLKITTGSVTASTDIHLLEYTPNAFEINLSAPENISPASPTLAIPISARYLLGKPLSKAQVKWSATFSNTQHSFSGYKGFLFQSHEQFNLLAPDLSNINLNGQFDLGASGNDTITLPQQFHEKYPQPRWLNLSTEITDINQQTLSKELSITLYPSAFALGIQAPPQHITAGDSIPIALIAVKPDGNPWPHILRPTLTLHRLTWQTHATIGASGTKTYTSQPHLEKISTQTLSTLPLKSFGKRWILENENRIPSITLKEAGEYLLEITTQDPQGCPVGLVQKINVSGKETNPWAYRNPVHLDLIPDRTSYTVGNTARILIKSPIDGTAYVTIERERIHRTLITQIKSRAPIISIPITEEDAPNVAVSVVIVRGSEKSTKKVAQADYRYGYTMLDVQQPHKRLAVSVKSSQDHYLPGTNAEAEVTVLNHRNRAVKNAEVTLYAVDEGILSLTGYKVPDPFKFFYKHRPHKVTSSITLEDLFPEDPSQRRFDNKGFIIGGGGTEANVSAIRSQFKAIAFWCATLKTDTKGRISQSFKVPDNLTRFRVFAIATHDADSFGSAESSFEIRKPIMITPYVPRLANVGDTLDLRATVHNLTQQDAQALITLKFQDTASAPASASPSDPATQLPVLTRAVSIPKGTTVPVSFPITCKKSELTKWTWHAEIQDGPSFVDAVETSLPISYPIPILKETHLHQSKATSINLLTPVNPQVLESTQIKADTTVSSSPALEFMPAFDHLLAYPYGCLEQTLSATLPWVLLYNNPRLAPFTKKSPEEIHDTIQASIARIASMRVDNENALGYWPNDTTPNLWGSAYAALVLGLAEKRGIEVPLLEGLYSYLEKTLEKNIQNLSSLDTSAHILALLALSMGNKKTYPHIEFFVQERDRLNHEDRTLLALAILYASGNKQTASSLLKEKGSLYSDFNPWFGSEDRLRALTLLLQLKLDPQSPRLLRLFQEILESRKDGHWRTTQSNAWTLLAFSEYLESLPDSTSPISASLLDGAQTIPIDLNGENFAFQYLSEYSDKKPLLKLTVENPAQHLIYSRINLAAYPFIQKQPAQNRGFSIRRTYHRLDESNQTHPLTALKVGDRVLVTLEINNPEPASYIAIEDPLPALFEPIQPEFTSQSTAPREENMASTLITNYREIQRDRVLFFINHLNQGYHITHYLARVICSGTATAPAAKIEAMYLPERFGLTETQEIQATPWDE